MAAKGPKGAKPTPNRVKAKPGRTPDSQLVPYNPPDVLEDLKSIKGRIRKATYNGRDLNQLAKVFTIEALTVFVECVTDPDATRMERMYAARELMDRGWGKASQVIAGDNDKPIAISIKWEGE